MFAHFGVPSQPALVIVAPDGTTQRLLGAVSDDELDELFDAVAG